MDKRGNAGSRLTPPLLAEVAAASLRLADAKDAVIGLVKTWETFLKGLLHEVALVIEAGYRRGFSHGFQAAKNPDPPTDNQVYQWRRNYAPDRFVPAPMSRVYSMNATKAQDCPRILSRVELDKATMPILWSLVREGKEE